jgi:Caspase domain/TIR domain
MDTIDAMRNAHALVIGIANYHSVAKLPQMVLKDARDIGALLVDPSHCAYPAGNVKLLLDGEATRDNIRAELKALAERTDANSTVFFYLSSHGARIDSGPNAGEYLLPVDTVYPNYDRLAQTALPGAEFSEALQAVPARKVLVVLDCCHAAGVAEIKDLEAGSEWKGLSAGFYEALSKGKGRVILASSRHDEKSYVKPNAANSLFTQHLLAGFQGGIASDDGLIKVFDLFEYLQPRVTADEPRQHPIFKAVLEQNFPVALYLGGKEGVVAKDTDGYRYDAYLSYADQGADRDWLWQTLVPHLEKEGLRVAVSGDVEEPGVGKVLGWMRAIEQAKRIVVVLSDRYLQDHIGETQTAMAQWLGIQEGQWRVLPVQYGPMQGTLPLNLSFLVALDLGDPYRGERQFQRLVQALKGPVPVM